jgi:hypothetical protein
MSGVVRSASVLLVALAMIACSGGGESAGASPASGGGGDTPAATGGGAAEPGGGCGDPSQAGPSADDPTFELRATARGPYAPGEQGRFEVSLTPRGVYHVNTQYPMAIRLQGPVEVSFPSAELGVDDAAEIVEPRARFDVPFTARSAGEHRVLAEVDFAVCTPESCMPDCRTLAVVLPVPGAPAVEAPVGDEAAGATN